MQFYRTEASTGVMRLSACIRQSVAQGQPVLWIISGGSNIPLTIDVMKALSDTSLHTLTIMLSDERYGDVGHHDSNGSQLETAGFDSKDATFLPVLTGLTLEQTTERYNHLIGKKFDQHSVIIGQLGIGADGHTAGILPYSPATTAVGSLVTHYKASDFSRITLTFAALRHLSSAFVFAYGETKGAALKQLKDYDVPPASEPAQILKAIPQTYIYNDALEGVVEQV